MAAKVRYSGVYLLLIVVKRSVHSRLWLRFILRNSLISYVYLLPWSLKTLCHPPGFKNPYATLFYATPRRSKIFMPPTFMPPPKNLMPPRLCHPQGWHKKRGGVALKKNQWPQGRENFNGKS